jgi:hypothetical protein
MRWSSWRQERRAPVLSEKRHVMDDANRQQSSAGRGAAMTTKIYWFVAAVFREIEDLAATLPKLRAQSLLADGLLILAPRMDDIPMLASAAPGNVAVAVATVDGSASAWQCVPGLEARLGSGLRELLEAAQSAVVAQADQPDTRADGNGQSRIYAQLWKDADEGANILVANVANAAEQLSVARIFLRQNCERVLTHEIAARAC